MKTILIAVCAAALLTGCATNKTAVTDKPANGEDDARMVRSLVDSMASPVHSFPANLPR